jgi:hypothetical protein
MVARPGIGEATLLPKASVASRAAAVGLQASVMIDVPKEGMADGVAPGGSCGDSVPVAPTALLASRVVLGLAAAIPVVGHIIMVPMVLPGIGPKAPRLNCIAPSAFPGPTAGIAFLIVGALRGDVGLTCAKANVQPNNTMVVVMKIRLRIGTSCV